MRPAIRLGGPARRRQLTSHVLQSRRPLPRSHRTRRSTTDAADVLRWNGSLQGKPQSAAGQEVRTAAAAELAADQVAAVTLAPPKTLAVVGLVGRTLLWTLEAR